MKATNNGTIVSHAYAVLLHFNWKDSVVRILDCA